MSNLFGNEHYFKTPDLHLATTISLWIPVEDVDRSDPRKLQFIFKQTKKLESLVNRYWRGELKVDPKEYSSALRDMKTRIYSENIQARVGDERG